MVSRSRVQVGMDSNTKFEEIRFDRPNTSANTIHQFNSLCMPWTTYSLLNTLSDVSCSLTCLIWFERVTISTCYGVNAVVFDLNATLAEVQTRNGTATRLALYTSFKVIWSNSNQINELGYIFRLETTWVRLRSCTTFCPICREE